MPKKKSRKQKSKTKITKIVESSSSNQSSPISKRIKNIPETKNTKFDESSSSNQSSPISKRIKNIPETKNTKFDENSASIPSTSSQYDPSDGFMDTGTHDFAVIRPKPGFVDKTMLIKVVLTNAESRIVLIAPRRFGKSINLSMMKHFLEILPDEKDMDANRKLFEGLDIAKHESIMKDHQGKWPIILLDFKCDRCIDSHDKAIVFIRTVIHEAYQRHMYLASSDKLIDTQKRVVNRWCDDEEFRKIPITTDENENGLKNLAKYLKVHFDKKVLLLVDEYDSLCSEIVINIEDTKVVRSIIKDCMGSITCLVKSNDNVDRAVLTGISYIATMGVSGLGNVEVCKFQEENEFSKFYGITLEELQRLLEKCGRSPDFEKVTSYYNGYRGDILNIYSVMKYFNHKFKLGNYWRRSGVVNALKEPFRIPTVRSIVSKLLSKLSNEVEIDYLEKLEYDNICDLINVLLAKDLNISNINVFLNFILEQGYFKISELNELEGKCKIQIPNLEIRSEFCEKFISYCEADYRVDMTAVRSCASLFDKLNASDKNNKKLLPQICDSLNRIINPVKCIVRNEATLHHIIFLVSLFCSNFETFSEIRKTEKDPKRFDLLMLSILFELGIILELKYDVDAVAGLKQIKNRKYFQSFGKVEYNPKKKPVKYRLYMGLNLSKEKKMTLSVLFNCLDLSKKFDYQ